MTASPYANATPSVALHQPRQPRLSRVWLIPASALGVAAILAAFGAHLPNLAIFADMTLAVKLHLLAALAALLLGGVLLTVRKGRTFHRLAGWSWVSIMAVTAGSSLFITSINPGHYSLIHTFTGWTLICLPLAVRAARRHNVKAHRGLMHGLFFGGLIVAGVFTFLPGRAMFQMFFG